MTRLADAIQFSCGDDLRRAFNEAGSHESECAAVAQHIRQAPLTLGRMRRSEGGSAPELGAMWGLSEPTTLPHLWISSTACVHLCEKSSPLFFLHVHLHWGRSWL